jgi:hypothetical protein
VIRFWHGPLRGGSRGSAPKVAGQAEVVVVWKERDGSGDDDLPVRLEATLAADYGG